MVITAKDSIVKLLNSTVANINPQAPALELSKDFIEDFHNSGQATVDLAKQQLKKEVGLYL